MNIEEIRIADLKPYPNNAKKHPAEQVEHIAHSIKEFGFRQPLVIDADNEIVIGHGRLLAAKKLGMKTVPCVRADDLDEEQIRKTVIKTGTERMGICRNMGHEHGESKQGTSCNVPR